jgi:outer membrane receptor protein involved in Fe transport
VFLRKLAKIAENVIITLTQGNSFYVPWGQTEFPRYFLAASRRPTWTGLEAAAASEAAEAAEPAAAEDAEAAVWRAGVDLMKRFGPKFTDKKRSNISL